MAAFTDAHLLEVTNVVQITQTHIISFVSSTRYLVLETNDWAPGWQVDVCCARTGEVLVPLKNVTDNQLKKTSAVMW